MMNKKLKVVSAILGIAVTLGAVGCASKEVAETDKTKVMKGKTLRILTADDTTEGGALHAIAEKYEKEKGVDVEVIELPYGDLSAKLMNMMKAGNAPAVVKFANYTDYVDYLLPLDDIVPKTDIVPGMLQNAVIDGKLLALPSNVTANGMLYNKTLFDKAGIKAPQAGEQPWTWEEFIVNIKQVVEKTDAQYGMVWDHSQHRYATLLYQYGGSIYNEDITATTIANETSIAAAEFFVSMFDDVMMPKSTWVGTEDPAAMFKTGRVAVHMAGNWSIPDYTKNITDFEWGSMLMPYKEERATLLGGNYIYAIDGSGMEKEAKDFISWFYSTEPYTEYCEIGSYLPGKVGITPNYEYPQLEVFNDELAATTPRTSEYGLGQIKYPGVTWANALRDNIDLAISGQITARQAMEQTEQAILDAYEGFGAQR